MESEFNTHDNIRQIFLKHILETDLNYVYKGPLFSTRENSFSSYAPNERPQNVFTRKMFKVHVINERTNNVERTTNVSIF